MKNHILTSKIMIIGLSLVLLFTTFGCATAGPDDGDPTTPGADSPVDLTVWLFPGMGLDDLMQEYADEHNINLNIQLADYDDLHTNLTTALAAGAGAPDISAVEIAFIERFKQNPEHFHNLLDFGAENQEDNYLDWKWEQAMTGDRSVLLGLPTDIGPQAMAYRLDIFEAAGLPTDRNEIAEQINTWEDFIEAGRQVREATGSAMIANSGNMFNVIMGQGEDHQFFDREDNLALEENPQVEKAWNLATQAIEDNITANIGAWSPEWGAGMTNGDFAVELAPAWMMGQIRENAPDVAGLWDLALMPEGSGNWGGSFLTIPAESRHAEAAYGLIQHVVSPENQLQLFIDRGNFPSTPGIYDEPAIQEATDEYFNDAPYGQIFSEAAQLIEPVYQGPFHAQVNTVIQDALGSIEDGQTDAEAAWDNALEEVRRQLER